MMDVFATAVGYGVLAAVAGGAIVFCLYVLIARFPLRFQWTIKPPSYIKTPNQIQNIDALIGVSNRGAGPLWFVGFMAVSPGQEPAIRSKKR